MKRTLGFLPALQLIVGALMGVALVWDMVRWFL